jgi:hypothetical protein
MSHLLERPTSALAKEALVFTGGIVMLDDHKRGGFRSWPK